MLFSFLLASCLVPAYRPDINFALYYQVSATKLLGNLYYAHPLCTAFLNMLMIGIFAGAWATIPLALSFFEKNKFVVLFAPYLVLLYIIASLQKASVYRSFTETSVLNYIWMTSSSSNQAYIAVFQGISDQSALDVPCPNYLLYDCTLKFLPKFCMQESLLCTYAKVLRHLP